jgi:putative N-acetylmannosamine-6-phosphate epimerase
VYKEIYFDSLILKWTTNAGEMLSKAQNEGVVNSTEAQTLGAAFLATTFASYRPETNSFRKPDINIFREFIDSMKILVENP